MTLDKSIPCKHGFWTAFLIVAGFLFSVYGRGLLTLIFKPDINNTLLFTLYFYMWWLIPSLVITIFLFGNQILYLFGFNKGILKAFVFALICTFPMFLSSSVLGTLNYGLTIDEIFIKSIGPGLMEEFLFRGFLFGLLFYKNKCGFIPSALLGAITFGLLHLYQGNGVAHSAGVFLITAMGAVWFAWLYVEWNKNLWVPVFLHALMNLSWLLFEVSPDALGGYQANIFRSITIVLSILITIYYHKYRGLIICKRNLKFNKEMNKI